MVDTNVSALVSDVAELKADVQAVADRVSALQVKSAVAIDQENLDAVKAVHADLANVHAALAAIAKPADAAPVPVAEPAPAAPAAPAA